MASIHVAAAVNTSQCMATAECVGFHHDDRYSLKLSLYSQILVRVGHSLELSTAFCIFCGILWFLSRAVDWRLKIKRMCLQHCRHGVTYMTKSDICAKAEASGLLKQGVSMYPPAAASARPGQSKHTFAHSMSKCRCARGVINMSCAVL